MKVGWVLILGLLLLAIRVMCYSAEAFSVSAENNSWGFGDWPSVFLGKPYVIRVESDPLSIPTATYVPTRQPCMYPPCPAPDVYQQA